jgi:hypothetical protein
MTRQRTFIVSAVISGVLSFGWAAHAGFPWLRIPAATCEVHKGSSSIERSLTNINTMSASSTVDVTLICPITTDTPDQYNRFNVHFVDKNPQKLVSADACVEFFGVIGGSCFGDRGFNNSASFVTPAGAVSHGTYPVFDTWANHHGDFPFIKVKLPARGSCSNGAACFAASSLRGLFLFTN